MVNPNKRTYENSYLFTDLDPEMANKKRQQMIDFILNAERIEDKRSDAFRGIVEDVKRMQRTSILYSILMSDKVILAYRDGKAEMPAAFKVMEIRDVKTDREPKIFIDVTGLITFKDGYYSCKKIDVLVSYLFCALNYALYSYAGIKLMNNSSITISGTECFVSMFTYVLDYLRIIGYSQNKEKISYLAGLYFLNHLMGKDIDSYCKNIAAKTAGISTMDTKAFELYYDSEKDFRNIDTFIQLLSDTFKLKGFTTEVFIQRWMTSFRASGYDSELYTSFANLIINAYSGSYIVNQKQIERCCGASMVKFCTSILQLGVSEFDNRAYMESDEFDDTIARDKNTESLKEAVLKRKGINVATILLKSEDFKSKSATKNQLEKSISMCRAAEREDRIITVVKNAIDSIVTGMKKSLDEVADGCLIEVLKTSKNYIKSANEKDLRHIKSTIDDGNRKMNSLMINAREKDDKEKSSLYAKRIAELRKASNMI